jgi:hypothetical protein
MYIFEQDQVPDLEQTFWLVCIGASGSGGLGGHLRVAETPKVVLELLFPGSFSGRPSLTEDLARSESAA